MSVVVEQLVFQPGGGLATITFASVNASLGNAVHIQLAIRGAGDQYLSATWNGGSVSPVAQFNSTASNGLNAVAAIFTGLTGTQSLAFTLNATPDDCEGWACSLSGVDTTTPWGTPSQVSGVPATTPFRATVSSMVGGLVLTSLRARTDIIAASPTLAEEAGQTVLDGPQYTATSAPIMFTSKPGAASVTSGFTFNDTINPTVQILAVPVRSLGGAGVMRPSSAIGTGGMQSLTGGMQGRARISRNRIFVPSHFQALQSNRARAALRV